MAKKYIIRDGFSFVGDNGEVKLGGEIISLDDDIAAQHAHKLEACQSDGERPAQQPAQQPQESFVDSGERPAQQPAQQPQESFVDSGETEQDPASDPAD